ncbi:hypothetical protein PAXINDRAFT_9437 [Paxillus involutus ATCC 200175]|nr:hypothetical protein PAXINDRAFT_9437 [Paxillus involutus ATCC 200175]
MPSFLNKVFGYKKQDDKDASRSPNEASDNALLDGNHHPSSPPSVKALAMLRSSLSAPYPPDKPNAPPLDFNLEVIESKPPTPHQLRIILSNLSPKDSAAASPSYSTFLSSHPSAPALSEQPHSAIGVVNLALQNPNALKWPVVVDWNGGRASQVAGLELV